jgi:hypothetical protein
MKYWSSQILFRLSDSFLQFKVMVLTLSLGLVLSFLEGGVSSSFIIADSCCLLGQIGSIHYLLIASQLHCFHDDSHIGIIEIFPVSGLIKILKLWSPMQAISTRL